MSFNEHAIGKKNELTNKSEQFGERIIPILYRRKQRREKEIEWGLQRKTNGKDRGNN